MAIVERELLKQRKALRRVLLSDHVPDFEIADAKWRDLEAAAGVKFAPENRICIGAAIRAYFEYSWLSRVSPLRNTLVSRLADLAKKAAALAEELEKLQREEADQSDRAVQKALDEQAVRVAYEYPFVKPLTKGVRRLAEVSASCAEAYSGGTGAEGDPHLAPLLETLHRSFRASGGQGRYTKESIDFLVRACQLAGAKVHSPEALRQRLKLIVKR